MSAAAAAAAAGAGGAGAEEDEAAAARRARRAARKAESEESGGGGGGGGDELAEFRRRRAERRAARLQAQEFALSGARERRFAARREEEERAAAAAGKSSSSSSSSSAAASAAGENGNADADDDDDPHAPGRAVAALAGGNLGPPLSFRQLVNLFLSVGVEQKTAADILEGNAAIGALTEQHAPTFKQVLREALQVLDAEGVPQDVFRSRTEEAAAAAASQAAVKTRTVLCKVCRDGAAIQATYPEVMVRYFRRTQRFRGDLTKDDWLCKGCYGSWYGDNLDFVKELQAAEEQVRRKMVADAVARADGENTAEDESDEDSDDDDEAERAHTVQKELYLKAIAYPLFVMTVCIEEKALQHRKFLTRYITLGKVRLVQIPAALQYLRKNTVVEEAEFEHACGVGAWSEAFVWTGWDRQATATEILKIDAASRARAKAEKRAAQDKLLADRRAEKEAADRAAEAERESIEARRAATREAEDQSIADKRARLADARKREDDATAKRRKKEDADRERRKDMAADEAKREGKRRAAELKRVEDRIADKEKDLRQDRQDRARKQRRERERAAREERESVARLEEEFRKDAAARRERERERRQAAAAAVGAASSSSRSSRR